VKSGGRRRVKEKDIGEVKIQKGGGRRGGKRAGWGGKRKSRRDVDGVGFIGGLKQERGNGMGGRKRRKGGGR